MIGPATGIKRGFYHSFAKHLAERGYGVITFDNRGIGDSRGEDINNVDASLINWGRLDMTAVLEHLKQSFKNTPYHLVGHSAGGQLLGLMPNAGELTSFFNYAASSGSLSMMPYPFKISAHFFMNIFIPFNNLLFGKTNSQWVGMGDPLPKLVAQQWSRWCNGKGYVAVDFGKQVREHWYNEIAVPSRWLYASDDSIATADTVPDMVRIFPKSDAEIIRLNPKELGLKTLGHMRFFSSRNEALWSYAVDWFDAL